MFLSVLALLIGVFNACSGAALRKQEILNSLSSSLDHAQTKDLSAEELEKEVDKNLKTEAPPEKADPKKFNHFPYDLKLDTIAYMGHVDTNSKKNPKYFTFKAGAYFSQSGLRMSEYFLEKSGTSAGALTSLIKSSTTYGAVPYFSIVPKNDLSASYGALTTNHFLFQPSKLTQEIVNAKESRIRTTEYGDPIEASLNLQAGHVGVLKNRDKLILHYKQKQGTETVHIPDWKHAGGENDIYGRLYQVKMMEPSQTTGTGEFRRIIQSITEQRLPKKHFEKAKKPWLCPSSLRFEIRRNARWAWNRAEYYHGPHQTAFKRKYEIETLLPDEQRCSNSCSESNNSCKIAKKVLGDDWNINTNRKCISLKSPAENDRFYMFPDPHRSPDYRLADIGKPCNATSTVVVKIDPPRSSSHGNYCPFFLSICVRKN